MKKIYTLIATVCLLCGCKMAAPPITKLSDANKKFIAITKEDTGITPLLKEVNNTLWIYLPTEKSIINVKASGQKVSSSNKSTESITVKYIDAYFKGDAFHIEYDIARDKKYDQNYGYTSAYSEEYQKKQRALLYNLQRAYGDMETVPGDVSFKDAGKKASHKGLVNAYVKTADAPDFFIFVVADIKNGIEAQTTIYSKDISKILSPVIQLPAEEATTRYLVDIHGDKGIINDKEGTHLDYKSLTLGDFLAKQIINRINFKYTRSSFPPSDIASDEILKAVAKSISLYSFNDFTEVILSDLRAGTTTHFSKADLERYKEDAKANKPPQYHIIQFNGNQNNNE